MTPQALEKSQLGGTEFIAWPEGVKFSLKLLKHDF